MHLSVKGKQLDVGAALREHIEGELPTLIGKYFDNPIDAQVTVSKEGPEFRADITVHVGKGILLQGHASSGDAHAAFDIAAGHVGKRLRRYKRRLRNHHKGREEVVEASRAQQYVLAAEPDDDHTEEPDQPVVIAEMETEIETLTTGEAVMRMDLANQSVLMFRNRAHGGLNMIYRRDDGNIGWVDPRGTRGTDVN